MQKNRTPSDYHLRSFVRVVRTGSLRQAAQSMGISQPALSKQINHLERALDTKLFRRTNIGTVPTAQGLQLFEKLGSLFDDIDASLAEIHTGSHLLNGNLVIGVIETFSQIDVLWDTLRLFCETNARVNTTITTDYSEQIIRRVLSGEYDFGIIHDNIAHSNELDVRILSRSKLALIYSNQHFDRRQLSLIPERNSELSLITFESESALGRLVKRFGQTHRIPIKLEVNSMSYLLKSTAEGFGITILPHSFPLHSTPYPNLEKLILPILTTKNGNCFVTRKRGALSREAQEFASMLMKALKL